MVLEIDELEIEKLQNEHTVDSRLFEFLNLRGDNNLCFRLRFFEF